VTRLDHITHPEHILNRSTQHAPVTMPVQMTSVEPLPIPLAVITLAVYWMMQEPATRARAVQGTKPPVKRAAPSSSQARRQACRGTGGGGGGGMEQEGLRWPMRGASARTHTHTRTRYTAKTRDIMLIHELM
jgi:hypothetical protein